MTATLPHIRRLFELITARTGISLTRASHGQLQQAAAFVAKRVEALELADPEVYLDQLRLQSLEDAELASLIGVITNSHTFFYRDAALFETIASVVSERGGTCDLLSAGCATGEEAYTLAMLCDEAGVDVRVVGWDVSAGAVAAARVGRYGGWALRRLPERLRARYFREVGDDTFEVVGKLRRRVSFEVRSLTETRLPVGAAGTPWSVVVCRNVLIYLSREHIRRVVDAFGEVLSDDGWLFTGATESPAGMGPRWRLTPVGRTLAYRPVHPLAVLKLPVEPPPPEGGPRVRLPTPHAQPVAASDALATRDGEALFMQAVHELAEGDFDGGAQTLERALAVDEANLMACLALGNIHLRAGRFEEALASYQQAQQRHALDPEVHYLTGVALRKLQDWEAAVDAFRRALFLEPTYWPAAFLLAGLVDRLRLPEVEYRRALTRTLKGLRQRDGSPLIRSLRLGLADLAPNATQVSAWCQAELQDMSL